MLHHGINSSRISKSNSQITSGYVYDEFNTLNQRLTYSTNEVAEYQAELMVASQEDEGATIRIEELERRGAIMEIGRTKCLTFEDYWATLSQGYNKCNTTVILPQMLPRNCFKKEERCKLDSRIP